MDGLRRKMDGSDEGVATTVGTIMALLIFLSILSLITQQYVPIWMEDNEAYHMDEVKGQFAELKGNIDTLVLEEKNYPLYSSVNLGTSGVPLFAGSSPGRLTFSPRGDPDGGMYLNFNDTEAGEEVSFTSSGTISYEAINREFEDQTLVYEQGAIILDQSDGTIIRAKPHISIDNVTGEYEVSMTMIHLTGSSRDVAGTSRVGITTELVSTFSNTYTDIEKENLNWSLTTEYPEVWKDYFNNETDAKANITNGNSVNINFPRGNITELEITRVRVEVEVAS